MRREFRVLLIFSICVLGCFKASQAQYVFERVAVDVSNMGISYTNVGTIGRPGANNQPVGLPSMQYPDGSGTEHLFEAGIWLGAQVNGQTRVSTSSVTHPSGFNTSAAGFEFTNNGDRFLIRSSLTDSENYTPQSVSHQDLVVNFTDRNVTRNNQPIPGHENPLYADVRMEVYNWNFGFTDGISIVRYDITNNSAGDVWEEFYFSLYSDMVVRNVNTTVETGSAFFNKGGMGWLDDLHAMYVFDRGSNDQPRVNTYGANVILGSEYRGVEFHPRNAEEVQAEGLPVPTVSPDFWLFGAGTGDFTRPNSDDQRYERMRTVWPLDNYREQLRNDGFTANGNYIQLNTIGPFPAVEPGETITIYIAFVAALMPDSFQNLMPGQVQDVDALDNEQSRAELVESLDWAYRLFDGQENPDGSRTRFLVPEPPDVPRMRVELGAGTASVFWDDRAESSIDPVSGEEDFAGYRLYRTDIGDDLRGAISTSATLRREWNKPGAGTGLNEGFEEIRLDEPMTFPDDPVEYIYRYDFENLQSGWQYLFSVTAFDEGDGSSPPLETAVNANAVRVFPGTAPNTNFDEDDDEYKVGVYPNPYRVNAAWDGGTSFTRKLMFYNLPARSEIRIYTLAGEVVATLSHNAETYSGDTRWFRELSAGQRVLPGGEHAWDLLSQANQNLSTGLYLFTVKDIETGSIQRGKFAIIK